MKFGIYSVTVIGTDVNQKPFRVTVMLRGESRWGVICLAKARVLAGGGEVDEIGAVKVG